MGNGLASLIVGDRVCGRGQNLLAQFVAAQLQPLSPGTFWRADPSFNESDIFSLHRMGFELLAEVMAGGGVSRHAKYSAGILVQAVNRQRLQSAINRWQGLACNAALSRFQLARE